MRVSATADTEDRLEALSKVLMGFMYAHLAESFAEDEGTGDAAEAVCGSASAPHARGRGGR